MPRPHGSGAHILGLFRCVTKIADLVYEVQHEELLQDIGLHVFVIGLRDGAAQAIVLAEQRPVSFP